MSISDEAVEAAARSLHQNSDWSLSYSRMRARAALESAAEHMLAGDHVDHPDGSVP